MTIPLSLTNRLYAGFLHIKVNIFLYSTLERPRSFDRTKFPRYVEPYFPSPPSKQAATPPLPRPRLCDDVPGAVTGTWRPVAASWRATATSLVPMRRTTHRDASHTYAARTRFWQAAIRKVKMRGMGGLTAARTMLSQHCCAWGTGKMGENQQYTGDQADIAVQLLGSGQRQAGSKQIHRILWMPAFSETMGKRLAATRLGAGWV